MNILHLGEGREYFVSLIFSSTGIFEEFSCPQHKRCLLTSKGGTRLFGEDNKLINPGPLRTLRVRGPLLISTKGEHKVMADFCKCHPERGQAATS